MPPTSVLFAAAAAFAFVAVPAAAQTYTQLVHQPPDGALMGFLLTDGTVLVQGGGFRDWWRLTPDIGGSYRTGTWKQAASLPSGYEPLYFASGVLADGRVVIAGGEYNAGNFAFSNRCAVYDPVADKWTSIKPPAGWQFIGDSPSTVLPDGRFLVGRKFDTRMAALDPKTLTWTVLASTGKIDIDAEEGWTLLPDGTVLTYDVTAAPHAEAYDPTAQRWTALPDTPVMLKGPPYVKKVKYGHGHVYHPPGEVGPGMLMGDGRVFATGAAPAGENLGHTAIYSPAAHGWTAGPDFPPGVDAGDSVSALLPTGNVLIRGSDQKLYEFDGTRLVPETYTSAIYTAIFMLPSGEALVSGSALYRAAGRVLAAAVPAITAAPATVTRGMTYTLQGRGFNGLSQASSFGDEVETNTNFPLARLTNTATGHVFYARTHDHSTMAVATGNATVSTQMDVPAGAETGPGTLEVVANGVASAPVAITVR